MTFEEIKTKLVAAGVPAYAVAEVYSGERRDVFVDNRDLAPLRKNKAVDKAIRALRFDVSDKGLIFLTTTS